MTASQTDYYELLGVSKDADAETIKKAFRRKARECHPDVSDAHDAEDKFKEINNAYDVLSDPAKRSQYDRYGSAGGAAGGYGGGAGGGYPGGYVDLGDMFGGSGAVDLGDLFSAFFGGVSGGGRGGVRLEGRDMAITIAIELEEAAQGIKRTITLDRLAPCDECNSTGAAAGTEAVTCPTCNGTGQVVGYKQTLFGSMQTATPCEQCHGTGSFIETPCEECEGSGRMIDRQQVNIDVPAGIRDGQQIRLREMGEAGVRGAQSGDLIVTVRVKEHATFQRSGSDLHTRLAITITEAALGATKHIDGLLGEVVVEVPAGSQTGDQVRLKGGGMPVIGKDTPGSLFLHLDVVVPKKLTERQRELLQELSDEFGDTTTSDADRHHKTGFEKFKDWISG